MLRIRIRTAVITRKLLHAYILLQDTILFIMPHRPNSWRNGAPRHVIKAISNLYHSIVKPTHIQTDTHHEGTVRLLQSNCTLPST